MEKELLIKIEKKIYLLRNQRVMLDSDLAELYGVETRSLNQAVKRNIERFPEDFSFIPTFSELRDLRSQIVILEGITYGNHFKHQPRVFTENGVAMLSTALSSKRAIQVNISIMRLFNKLRSFLLMEAGLGKRVDELEQNTVKTFQQVFKRLDHIEEDLPILIQTERKLDLIWIKNKFCCFIKVS